MLKKTRRGNSGAPDPSSWRGKDKHKITKELLDKAFEKRSIKPLPFKSDFKLTIIHAAQSFLETFSNYNYLSERAKISVLNTLMNHASTEEVRDYLARLRETVVRDLEKK